MCLICKQKPRTLPNNVLEVRMMMANCQAILRAGACAGTIQWMLLKEKREQWHKIGFLLLRMGYICTFYEEMISRPWLCTQGGLSQSYFKPSGLIKFSHLKCNIYVILHLQSHKEIGRCVCMCVYLKNVGTYINRIY